MVTNLSKYLLLLVFIIFINTAGTNVKENVGLASYYHNNLHGKKTANGERYDKYKMTCAHKTLPFGTVLRVIRKNDTIEVVVNDRGPFIKGRVLDLSYEAAKKLGMINKGIAKVKYEVLECEEQGNSGGTTVDWGQYCRNDWTSSLYCLD